MDTTTKKIIMKEEENTTDLYWLLPDNISLYYDFQEPSIAKEIPSILLNLLYVMYAATFLVAVVGNAMVCYIVRCLVRRRNKNKQTVPDFFIITLAIDDIMVALICIPSIFFNRILNNVWTLGTPACFISELFQGTVILHRALILVAIIKDSHNVSQNPLRDKLTKFQAKCIVFGSLLLSFIVSVPDAVFSKAEQVSKSSVCVEIWPENVARQGYKIFYLSVQYISPLLMMAVCYGHIAIIFCSRSIPVAENSVVLKSRRKTVKMMVIVTLCYAICWTPLSVITSMGIISSTTSRENQIKNIVWLFSYCLAISNSGVNPIVYGWIKRNYREAYKNALKRLFCMKTTTKRNDGLLCRHESIPLQDIKKQRRSVLTGYRFSR